jgi:hypothetical protein
VPAVFDEVEATYTLQQVRELDAYRLACAANTGIAEQHAAQIAALQTAAGHLVAAGKGQRVIADLRSEMLEDERRRHFWETAGLYVVIVALGFAAL